MHFNQELKEIALETQKNLQLMPKFANTGDEY